MWTNLCSFCAQNFISFNFLLIRFLLIMVILHDMSHRTHSCMHFIILISEEIISIHVRKSGGGGGGGDTSPHDLEGGGHNIKCPPPPMYFGDPKEDLFGVACLLVREVGDVWGYPYPVSGKLTQKLGGGGERRSQKLSTEDISWRSGAQLANELYCT